MNSNIQRQRLLLDYRRKQRYCVKPPRGLAQKGANVSCWAPGGPSTGSLVARFV